MKIAIIGAGFAGLATAYFLLESGKARVTLFEATKIGGGASGVASGLMHPYAGFSAKRSQRATQALAVSKQLLRVSEKHTPKIVASQSGILRSSMNEEQHERLLTHASEFGDVEHLDDRLFMIHSGITVMSENYLTGLAAAIFRMGGEMVYHKVRSLMELDHFDHVVIAAGFGIKAFPECENLKVKFLKGQALNMKGSPPHEKSFISKGFISHLGSNTRFEIGSTYERDFSHTAPDMDVATKLLRDKLDLCEGADILDVRAGVRVCAQGHYAPIIEQVGEKIHVFTGLGSRGLLYHGLYGKTLANMILSKNRILT